MVNPEGKREEMKVPQRQARADKEVKHIGLFH
jgi:hypothetical protein